MTDFRCMWLQTEQWHCRVVWALSQFRCWYNALSFLATVLSCISCERMLPGPVPVTRIELSKAVLGIPSWMIIYFSCACCTEEWGTFKWRVIMAVAPEMVTLMMLAKLFNTSVLPPPLSLRVRTPEHKERITTIASSILQEISREGYTYESQGKEVQEEGQRH